MADELLQLDKNSRVVLGAIDKDTGEIRYVGMDEDSRGMHICLWVYDTDTLAWVKMTQPLIDASDSTLYLALDEVEALLTMMTDALGHYQASDIDESGDPAYYGFLDKDGNWYIMEANAGSGTYRYEKGSSGYAAAWTGKAGLTYGYFDAEF